MKTKIRELRKARKLSQEELADAVGNTVTHVTFLVLLSAGCILCHLISDLLSSIPFLKSEIE